jgi:methionyl-tRNA formyltransferase
MPDFPHDKLAALASGVLAESLAMLAAGNAPRMPQDEAAATHVGKLCRDDGRLDWGRPAADLERRIRAYDPWPGTFTTFRHHGRCKRLKIFPHSEVADSPGIAVGSVVADGDRLIVGCGCGALAIGDVQPEGGKRMSAGEFARGHHITVLGGE